MAVTIALATIIAYLIIALSLGFLGLIIAIFRGKKVDVKSYIKSKAAEEMVDSETLKCIKARTQCN